MTDILCNWLNDEVKISVKVDPTNFGKEFSTGYLLGEVLYKYQLQDDFDQFSQAKTADSKLNNFTRVEPVLHLLEVPFDTNVARDIMTERHGVSTRLMYQLFIALSKKQKNNLTGVAMETMRPPAPVKLENVESLIYKERLKHMTPRQTDLNLEALVGRYHQKQVQMEQVAFKERFEEEERYLQKVQEQRENLREQHRNARAKKSEMLAKIHPGSASTMRTTSSSSRAATVHIPKPPPNKTARAAAERRDYRIQSEAQAMFADIDEFEEKLRRTLPPSTMGSTEAAEVSELPDTLDLIKPSSNDDYINAIKKRLNEDSSARAEREKRRRKVLVDQLRAHEAQEDARREEMLVNRLMRQSQQERRIAVQLLQARHEKEVISKNRQLREKQYEERRLLELQEALDREAEMARLAQLEYELQTEKDKELHNQIMADRAKEKYTKHYDMCGDVLSDVIDLTTKVGEYRELTNKLLPEKLMRDWKTLFVEGQPLYEQVEEECTEDMEPTPEQILEEERQRLLDETDFNEFRNMMGEWMPPDNCDVTGPPADNPIVGHIVQRLLDIVHPPSPPPPAPQFPPFPIKACIMGKVFSGKSTACKRLAETHRLQVLDVEELVSEAIEAHKEGEVIEIDEPEEEPTPRADEPPSTADPTSSKATPLPDKQDDSSVVNEVINDNVSPQTVAQSTESRTGSKQDSPKSDDGMEKSDPEKPVPEEEEDSPESMVKTGASVPSTGKKSRKGSVRPSTKTPLLSPPTPQATARAKLGQKAMKFLKKGKTVEDALLVDVVIEAIRRIPEGTGWVLDGFPSTYAQAKLLEKALTGMDAASRENTKLSLKDGKGKNKKSMLAPDPRPPPPAPEPTSGLDVVIMFEVSDDLALKRSAGRTYASQSDSQYHQEFNPPPEGTATGINKQEKVLPVQDPAHDMEQIQHRLTMFQDTWPKMEKWFSKFGTLQKIDAMQEQETVFLELENILEQTLKKLQGPPPEETLTLETDIKEEQPAEPVKTPEPVPEKVEDPEESRSRPASKKGSRTGSPKRSGSRSGSAEKKTKKSPSRSSSKEGKKSSGKGSRGSSPKSPKRSKSGKKAKTPEPEPEPEPEVPPGTPPPQPGSDLWQYVDEPIEEELAHILAPHWDAVEETYINCNKGVFRAVREERERIIRYLYQIRQDYLAYLRRPDHKQEFVTQWQKDFNEVSDDLRDDEETRSELHQRVDDLRERVWSICDERKEMAEKERESIMTDGWVDDRVGILTNHYITTIQSEVDRFQETIRLLKDYYRGMEGKIPEERLPDYIRLPLVELPVEDMPEGQEEQDEDTVDDEVQSEPPTEETKPSSSKTRTPSGKKKPDEKPDDTAQEKKRIPLVPRRPASPDASGAGGKAKEKAKPKVGKESEDGPPPPTDLDEKLIFDAYTTGVQSLDKIMAVEQAAREAEEESERLRDQEREAEKLKAANDAKKKGGKAPKGGKKSRSPSPKKGRGKDTPTQPTPPPDQNEESEEEKQKKLTKERAKQEFFAAIQHEAVAAKTRMDLVRVVSVQVLAGLKDACDSAYKDMNDWLGARFLKEMGSIDQMSEVMRYAVENGTKIHQELKIDQEDFLVNQDIRVLRTPTPQPRPDPVEEVEADSFTVDQIMNIYNQFALTAPTGMLTIRTFQEILTDVTSLSHGSEQVPESWLNISPEKLEALAMYLSSDGQYIDWHGCLLQLAQPWPVPTQSDLLDTLDRFRQMDQSNTGHVTREQYHMVDLWFSKQGKPATPEDVTQPLPYDRLHNLKAAFFEIFADHTSEPAQLDFVNMLLYFSIASDPYDGFLRALSVAAGTHMPRLSDKRITIRKPSRPVSQASMVISEVETVVPGDSETKSPEDIPDTAINAAVPLDALDRVLHHGQSMRGDSHRFSVSADPEDAFSRERLAGIYQELGCEDLETLLFVKLIEHPVIQDILSACNTYRALELKMVLANPATDTLDVQSLKAGE